MPMGQVQYRGNPYMNTYDSGFQCQAQMTTSRLEEAMAELAKSQESSQDEISQPPQVQKSPGEEVVNELGTSQARFINFKHNS